MSAVRPMWTAVLLGALAALAVPVTTGLTAGTAGAATNVITVATTADGGGGSLRAAFATASSDGTDSEIVLAAGATYSLTDCGAGGGDLEHTENHALLITGNGATIRQTCANQRVILNNSTGQLTVDGVTITGGNDLAGGEFGAGLESSLSPGPGFGGDIVVRSSTITGNATETFGGGIDCICDLVTVVDSTISNNTADGGAAIGAGAITVVNSTITGNTSVGGPTQGAISAGDTLTLVYATIVGNTGAASNNLELQGNLVSFGSVVAQPPSGGKNCLFKDPTTTSNGYNFSDDATCGFTGTGDRQSAGSPGLGALAANGGPTQTMLPATGSPLIDGVPTASCQTDGADGVTTDQRGVTRPQGAGCDVGAVEVEVEVEVPAPPVVTEPSFTG